VDPNQTSQEDFVNDLQQREQYLSEEAFVTADGRIVFNESEINRVARAEAERQFNDDPVLGTNLLMEEGLANNSVAAVAREGMTFDQLGPEQQQFLTNEAKKTVDEKVITHEHAHLLFRIIVGQIDQNAQSAEDATLLRQELIDSFGDWLVATLEHQFEHRSLVTRFRNGETLSRQERRDLRKLRDDRKLLKRAGIQTSQFRDQLVSLREGNPISIETADEFVAYYMDGIRSEELTRNPEFEQQLEYFFGLANGQVVLTADDGTTSTRELSVESFYELAHEDILFQATRYNTLGRRTRAETGSVEAQNPTISPINTEALLSDLQNILSRIVGTAGYKVASVSVLNEVKNYLEADTTLGFAEYMGTSKLTTFLTNSASLMSTLEGTRSEEARKITRAVLNILSDFLPLDSNLDSAVLSMVLEGRFRGIEDLRRVDELASKESDSVKKLWYQIQLQRLQQDIPAIASFYSYEQSLRNASQYFPIDLFPSIAEVVRGNQKLYDLKKPDGSDFRSVQELNAYALSRLRAGVARVFGTEGDFEIYLSVNPEIRGTVQETLLRAKRADVRAIRRYLRETGETISEDALLTFSLSGFAANIQENGLTVGRFYASEQLGQNEYVGVAVIGGELRAGRLDGTQFTAFESENSGQNFNIDVLKRQVILDQLRSEGAEENQSLIDAVEQDNSITLDNGQVVYKGEFLAAGGVGQVYRGVLIDRQGQVQKVAVKDILAQQGSNRAVREHAVAVTKHISEQQNPRGIAEIFGVQQNETGDVVGTIVTEFVNSGQEAIEMKEFQFASSTQADSFVRDLVRLIQEVHDRGMLISDLKAANVLVRDTGEQHPDGSAIVEPVIADFDSFLYRGQPEDYPLADPRRAFTFSETGLEVPIYTATTAPGIKSLNEKAGGEVSLQIRFPDPFLAKQLIENADDTSRAFEEGYNGIDGHALAWTLLFSVYGDNVTLGEFGDSLDYSTNLGEVLTQEQRQRYIAAFEESLGLPEARAASSDPEFLLLDNPKILSIERFKALLFRAYRSQMDHFGFLPQ
jgi:uncharacterized protein (DUF2267 family)